ncbi:TPA: hypothetical protein N0F65_005813 [Lagenidium giganteum]|uniref:Uncharacterized protein n=1 Tax=Lagenidium giganteum TaxID=4803 RepID=A0AAV2YTS3_9STRA|nr:TPA: hypothetical protein N0F65_005813 [Lagenidium giganteum]
MSSASGYEDAKEERERAAKAAADDKQAFAQEFSKPRMDATFLVNNYTAPALAAAYQDREYTLRQCAELLHEGKLDELRHVLKPYHDFSLDRSNQRQTPLHKAFTPHHLERIRKRLSRLPRQITKAYTRLLGILRCDWSNVTSITGIAVTPVVGFIGEMSDQSVVINEAEVDSLFTVPLKDLVNADLWIRRPNATPVFTGGPHVVWGLTAYLLDLCVEEVLLLDSEA